MEKLKFNYDVVVVGGGVAGVSAALSSARSGKKTLLVEATYMLGGLATAGLVAFYLPFDDGEGHQVSYGLCEELFHLSMSEGYEGHYPDAWLDSNDLEKRKHQRLEVQFNPNVFAILCEKKLKEEHVDIMYGAIVTGVEVENSRITTIHAATRTQHMDINTSAVVDSTGDATICEMANLDIKDSEHGNVLTSWYYDVADGEYNIHMLGSCDYVYSDGKEHAWFKGVGAVELSEQQVAAHQTLLNDFLSKGKADKKHALATIGTIPEIRMTRSIVGNIALDKADNGKYKEHSMGLVTSWLTSGLNYEIPYECLINDKVLNLYVAGRCISVKNDEMWDITRAIPGCVVTGEISGYLAANYPDHKDVDYKKSQTELESRGVKIHLRDIGL